MERSPYRVFLTHGSADTYFAEQLLLPKLESVGAEVFVDSVIVHYGEDFRDRIIKELRDCDELLVFLTPSSIQRPWVFAEIGACMVRPDAAIVAVTYGVTDEELGQLGILSLLGTKSYLEIQDFDRYISELEDRITKVK